MKSVFGNFGKLALTLSVLFVAQGVASAQENRVVIKGDVCYMLSADSVLFSTEDSQIVITNSKRATSKITCHGVQPVDATNPAVKMEWNYQNTGELCWVLDSPTKDWKETIYPDGTAILSCQFRSDVVVKK